MPDPGKGAPACCARVGGLGISDVIADDDSSPAERMQASQRVGCLAGVLTIGEYRGMLVAAGLLDAAITRTADHGDGVHSAIIQATKPTADHVNSR
jgi:hypothetical protein